MIIKTLNTKINIDELRAYYSKLHTDYQHLKWVKAEKVESIIDQWKDDSIVKGVYGWAIDSNLENIADPCPPFNISNKAKVKYRNTELAFGIVEQLQSIFSYGYRWAITVLQPEGYVNLHSDDVKNVTVWVPIFNPEKALFLFEQDKILQNYYLPADGSMYLVDTQYPHCTKNESTEERVILSFRCPRDNLEDLFLK